MLKQSYIISAEILLEVKLSRKLISQIHPNFLRIKHNLQMKIVDKNASCQKNLEHFKIKNRLKPSKKIRMPLSNRKSMLVFLLRSIQLKHMKSYNI
jgi:hypothetical protein